MPISNPDTKSKIFNSLPKKVQSAIVAYAESAELSPDGVIIFAIAHFLELESIREHDSHSHTESTSILNDLPTSLQTEIENYAALYDMPPEFVVELAIAHFLDPDSITFDDCQTRLQRDRLELLRLEKHQRSATVAQRSAMLVP
ncbi:MULTISPECIES: hypothetical protein [unclassified Coleofasciculus]|uniref:hypothetical protein n=1 Tax=unclassified Coleofasciculus TaxID=2692782 RepID=UPI0018830E17|nr:MULTISPECIES: hypothetical protein [unclassified Coleofasciculus]MBE9127491.1 hypothetical protein [Coleofasciculus sp. LEGE 07081]MBE9150763.1 hypothetical protein [Coleofasciculus sp. LEGE 07092]